MLCFRIVVNPEEMEYVKKVATVGLDKSTDGRHIYSTQRLKLFKELPGAVIFGCIVETEKDRELVIGSKDFGLIKALFYAIFSRSQAEMLRIVDPKMGNFLIEREGKETLFLSWEEYKEAVRIQ